ncbi:hypothetical protein SNE40_021582 [Patella caerulea]|uniref:EF-hand domain-containing protein n=1 Tax=Patella caerulea TaxID=87958 RepID=A0AAN8G849_PATCE
MPKAQVFLTQFQKDKLEYYFNFFDADGNKCLEMDDLDVIMKKILEFTGWEKNSAKAKECYEVHHVFFEVMREKATKENTGGKIMLKEWFDIWNNLLPGCKGMGNFPIWLRRLPYILFKMIDYKEDDEIDVEEMAHFYEKMVGLSPEESIARAFKGMEQMTDGGRYRLDYNGYEQIFANFLIGRTPHGPGRYIFGCFEDKVVPFQLIQPAADDNEEEDAKMKRQRQGRRRSSIDQRVKIQYRA